jgi:hypothetical protein
MKKLHSPLRGLTNARRTANKQAQMRLAKPLWLPEWIAAALITIAAIALHLHFWLHIGGLWRDEVNLVSISGRHSFGEMAKDSFPLAMPLIVHAWIAAGPGGTDMGLRFLGLLTGLGILATLWIANWKIRRAPPLLGLALFALNSSLIFWGDSLRAYGMGSLFAAALAASAFVYLKQPSVRRAVWLGFFAVLSVQFLYNNAVLVAAICFGGWVVCWRRKDKRAALQILIVAVVSAASLLPYLHTLIVNTTTSVILRSGVDLTRFFASYTDTLGYPFTGYTYIWILLYGTVVVLACAGFRRKTETSDTADDQAPMDTIYSRDLNLFAAVTLTLATIGFPIFFWRAQLPMQSWYVLPFMAMVAVCFDAVLVFRRWISRAALLLFVAFTACCSVRDTNQLLAGHFSSVNLYARLLNTAATPKDYIIVQPWLYGITFDHYYNGAAPWDTLPPLTDHSLHRFDLVQLQLQNTNAMEPVFQKMTQTLQSGHRVWILAARNWMGVPGPGQHPPASLPAAPLPNTGYADWPYTQVWGAQVACFLADHGSEFGQLKSLSDERFITEDMVLFAAGGWKTNTLAH